MAATQLAAVERARDALIRTDAEGRNNPAAHLLKLKGMGPEFASLLWLELLFRSFGNRRQVAAYAGLAPSPWQSGEETIEDFGESAAIDTGLVAAGQAVEHYEMARYGALIAWAGQLNMPKAAALLNESLQEEMKAEKLLTQIGASKTDKLAATKLAA